MNINWTLLKLIPKIKKFFRKWFFINNNKNKCLNERFLEV